MTSQGQIQVKGVVYDSLGRTPVPSVSVLTSSGKGTMTNGAGEYSLRIAKEDSIWFSYLGKPTRKFTLTDIPTPYSFDISLRINIPELPTVQVKNRDYRLDSLQNRLDYAKIFEFQRPGISTSTLGGVGGGVGFDLTEIVNAFRFRRTKRMLSFQKKLVTEEQDMFIKHRFSKALIRRITGMTEDSMIVLFIQQYQPSYFFTSRVNDYSFHKYIKDSYQRFEHGLLPPPLWREGVTGEEDVEY